MSTTTRERRIVAAFISFVLSPFTLFDLLSAAVVATGNPMGDTTSTPGTINVHKRVDLGGTLEYGDDNGVSAGGETLGGVPSTLYKVEGVDLVNGSADQDVVGKTTDPTKPIEPALDNQNSPVKVTIDGKKYTLKGISGKTTADGTGLAQSIDVYPGPYIVVESRMSLPLGPVIVAKAAPFFTTLSIKDARGTWSYTANVYPKSTVSPRPKKSAKMKNAVGDVVTWIVKQTLPTFDDINKFTEFRFKDGLSETDDTKGALASVKVTVDGKDKTSDLSKESVGLDGKHLVITTKNSGDLPSGGEIAAIYTTRALGNGQFRNGVLSFVNNVEVGHALVSADLGKITVEKLDATGKILYLSGAEFKVCVDEDGVEETRDCPAVGMITTEKSPGMGSLGKLKIQKYVLFEIATPANYTFNPDMSHKADLTTATYNIITLTVENTKTNVLTLPLTDTDGQPPMTIGGVALVLLVGGVFLVARKKHSEK